MKRLSLLFLAAALVRADSIVIKNVTVIDTAGGPSRPGMNVTISSDVIRSIGPGQIRPRKGVQIVDGTRKFLIPGLWDMHVHLWESTPMFALYLANGVTGVRDMGSDFARTNRWRKEMFAPRVYTSGPAIDGKPSDDPRLPIVVVTNNQEAVNAVNKLDDDGSDFIKILSRLTQEGYDAVAYRARLLRIPFAGHVPDEVSMWRALDARQKSIEHLFGVMLACSSEEDDIRKVRASAKEPKDFRVIQQRMFDTYSEGRCLELFRRSALMRVYHTPTLTLLARMMKIGVAGMAANPNLKYVPAAIRQRWQDPAGGVDKLTSEQLEQNAKVFNRYVDFVKVMRVAKTDILAGTDTGDDYVLPGFALHDELQWLVTAGLTPLEALRAATLSPAEYSNFNGGVVRPGKLADLVLLDANPLDDINHARQVRAVILRGKLLDRKQLDKMLADAEAVK